MHFDHAVLQRLEQLRSADLLRVPRVVSGAHGPEVVVDGRRVLDFCSNDYLGFASDPRLVAAARTALDTHGLGAPSSRHISGTTDLHRAAEARLASYVSAERALLFSSGYAANTGAIAALVDAGGVAFSDELNHASLIDGCRLSRGRVHVYRHLDLDHLEALLREHRQEGAHGVVVTESVFSMEGDLAPLSELRALCDLYELGLFVDEAHALGVVGPCGRGACAAVRVTPDVLVGTLGKAFGCSGAFVAGRAATVQWIENRSRSHVFSTAAPPLLAAAAATATEAVLAADDRRATLRGHVERIRDTLRARGHEVPDSPSAILPVRVGAADEVVRLSTALFEVGVFVHGIRPPTVPVGTSRLRITPMATHSGEQVQQLLDALACIAPANHR